MSATIPTHLLKKIQVLAEVPHSVFSDAPRIENGSDPAKRHAFLKLLRKGPKQATETAGGKKAVKEHVFNAAAWLKLAQTASRPIALAIRYRDERGEFAVVIEEATASETGALMLSGEARFNTTGLVESMQICCVGADANNIIKVEEVFVQPAVTENENATRRSA